MAQGRPDDEGRLSGRVVIVGAADADAAVALAGEDASIVVVGTDAATTGALVRRLTEQGGRAVAFVGDPATDAAALVEMVAELFPERVPGAPEPA